MTQANRQSIKQPNYEFAEWILTFLHAIHDDNPFEIRLFPEGRQGNISSILRNGDSLYVDLRDGNKSKKCKLTPENFHDLLMSEYVSSQGGAVCFTVNSPNFDVMESCFTSDKNIVDGGKINCQFTDIDAPKEVRNNPFQLKQWKRNVGEQILEFPLSPSIVVETKHGYHVYWLLENGQQKMFRHIQMQLIQFFDGDKNCVNESRVLRLPNFMHRKDPKKPYPIKVGVFEPKRKYTQEQLKNVLPQLNEETLRKVLKQSENAFSVHISDDRKTNIVNQILKKVDYVKVYDSKITMHCCMPDHPDKNPSAFISTDLMWYYCSGCLKSCFVHELAEELDWKDVLKVWNKYDLDIESQLRSIKEQLISVKDLPHLQLNRLEQELVNRIAFKVIDKFDSFGQQINDKHKQYVHDIVQIMLKANKEKPYLIPLDMGGGKSTIIKIFLQEMFLRNLEFGALVAVERKEDAKLYANEINKSVGTKIAYAMYGFDENECLLNVKEGNDFDHCIARKTYNCPHMERCRYWQQSEKQKEYPIAIITLQRMLQDSGKLHEKYGHFVVSEETKEKKKRELLLIDEKYKTTFVSELNKKGFKKFTEKILSDLHWESNGENELYNEFKKAIEKIEPLYNTVTIGRDIFEPIDKTFCFSDDLKDFFKRYDYTEKVYKIPTIIESIILNGGFREVKKKGKITLTTSYYHKYKDFANFKTIIFDGTADIDLEYIHEEHHVFDFEPLRTYDGLTIYKCNLVSGSKTSMKDEDKLKAFCEEVKSIANENPSEKIFIPVFKQNESDVKQHLKLYIESEQILVAHYGETRGSNKFKDCSIVILGGILHKGEHHYIGKAKALFEQMDIELNDITCSNYDKVRRFNHFDIEQVKILDMLVDYSQELKRSSQRDNSRNVDGKIYIFHNDKILLKMIGRKFPNSQFEEWTPHNIIDYEIFKNHRNKNVQAICNYILQTQNSEIYYEEIKEAIGISKQNFSNTMKNKSLQAFIKAKGFEVEKEGRIKKLVKVI
jgi:hypothetical protein